jgi:ferredoxin
MLPGGVTLEIGADERLLDACDDAAPGVMPVACRAANCGSCRLQVVAGGEAFLPASARERSTLQQLGAADDERLGCQLRCVSALTTAAIVLRSSGA